MWDLAASFPRLSTGSRKVPLLATVIFVASFLCSILLPTVALAVDAAWSGENLTYDGKTFTKAEPIKAGDKRNPVVGTYVYEYMNTQNDSLEVLFINKDTSDVTTATSAQYVVYEDFNPPDTFSDMSSPVAVTIDSTTAGTGAGTAGSASSCDSSIFEGLGWILCPVSNFLSRAVDTFYKLVASFMVVTTLTTDNNNSVYQIWKIVVSIANICFIIIFLYIVYLHLVSYNIDKVHLFKRALPRLLIAAILVNVSYWICALAVDASNLLGYSVEQIFKGVRDAVGLSVNVDWNTITVFILSAGAIGTFGGAIGAAGALATPAAFMALAHLLVAILIPVVFAAMLALIILAARQALIVVLIIISPLAFVAWTLPNTEKYFQKWFSAFSTLLLMFPIFSVIFGGSMLAGAAIMNSANGSLVIALIGMAVQVVPLIVTPLIIRFSTGILGQIANLTNNKSRGIFDRAANWNRERAGYYKDKNLGDRDNPTKPWQIGRRTGQYFASQKVVREHRRKGYQQNIANRAMETESYMRADEMVRDSNRDSKRIESTLDTKWNNDMKTNSRSLEREMAMRQAQQNATLTQGQIDLAYENARAGETTYGMSAETARRIQETSETNALTANAKAMADYRQRQLESDILINQQLSNGNTTVDGQAISQYAGGILREHDLGANKALAYAVATRRSQYAKGVEEANQLVKHFNPSSEELQDLVTGRKSDITGIDANGREFTFKSSNEFVMEAAIEKQVSIGTVKMVDEIISKSGSDLKDYRTTIADALAKAGHTGRSIYQGGALINEIAKGEIKSRDDLIRYVQEQIAKGKASPVKISTLDADAAALFHEAVSRPSAITNPDLRAVYHERLEQFRASTVKALDDEQIRINVADNARPVLEAIRDGRPYTP